MGAKAAAMSMRYAFLAAAATLALLSTGPANSAPKAAADPAAALQQRLLTLDSHLDTPASLALAGWSIMDAHTVQGDYTQVDLPRMKRGGLDGGFWAIYTAQGPLDAESTRKARDFALMRAAAIREMVAAHPESFTLASKAADAAAIKASGKRVVYLSIENAWPLGDDPTLLRSFHALGVRIAGFAHFRTNQFADSSTDKAKWDGLSPLGVQLLAEMNRLGVVPDLSHSSDRALDDALRLSKTPLVLTHSGCKAIFDHPRNVDDAHLKALAAAGGVIQINSVYVKGLKQSPEREAAMKALEAKYPEDKAMTAAERQAMLTERRAIDARYPELRASFDDVMANLLHAIKVAGIDHVGIGLDWDGGGGVTGLEDIVDLPKITKALLAAGYTEADVAKVWSGNVLRVLAAAEAEAQAEAKSGPEKT